MALLADYLNLSEAAASLLEGLGSFVAVGLRMVAALLRCAFAGEVALEVVVVVAWDRAVV